MAETTEAAVVRDLEDWWVFDKPKYDSWHLSVPNADKPNGMRWGIQLAGLETLPRPEAEAIAERIRGCLNGCVGINPDAVPELLEALQDIERTAGQPAMVDDPVRVKARAAISKALGN